MTLLNLKWQDSTNAGDCVCSPCLYFQEFMGADIVHINHWKDVLLSRYDGVLIGGGGLLNEENLPTIQSIALRHPKIVLCGVGTNSTAGGLVIPDEFGPNVNGWLRSEHCSLPLGPCPSCLHPALDELHVVRSHTGIVSHKDHVIPVPIGTSHITNNINAYSMIRFIGEHHKIITNSYHAAYWAWLLNRQVELTDKWSTKFDQCLNDWSIIGDLNKHRTEAWRLMNESMQWILN